MRVYIGKWILLQTSKDLTLRLTVIYIYMIYIIYIFFLSYRGKGKTLKKAVDSNNILFTFCTFKQNSFIGTTLE